jgi:adenosine deaminase
MTPVQATTQTWQALPKVLLHEHLDGGLRAQTLLDLCHERGLAVPAQNPSSLAAWIQANANSGSLERYLQGFSLTVAAMASVGACERVAFEAAEDARLDGCVLAEFRIAPLLLEPFGLSGDAVVAALVRGLTRSVLPCGLIVCAMRTDSPQETMRAAQLAVRYKDRGVIGFDIAGAERGFPPGLHARAFSIARDAGLGLTCHAGEADIGERVLEAAAVGATRIGHGVSIMQNLGTAAQTRLVEAAREAGLHFEVCPTSNVHTGAVMSLAAHPIRAMVEAGLSVSCSTDNRLMSGITLSRELRSVHEINSLTRVQIGNMMRAAADASFMPTAARATASAAMVQWDHS